MRKEKKLVGLDSDRSGTSTRRSAGTSSPSLHSKPGVDSQDVNIKPGSEARVLEVLNENKQCLYEEQKEEEKEKKSPL